MNTASLEEGPLEASGVPRMKERGTSGKGEGNGGEDTAVWILHLFLGDRVGRQVDGHENCINHKLCLL